MDCSDQPNLDAATAQRFDRRRRGRVVRDEQMDLLHFGNEGDVAADQLRGIGDHHHLARDAHHLGVELGLLEMRCHDPYLGIESIRPEVQAIRLQVGERRGRHRPGQRVGFAPQNQIGRAHV